MNNLNYGTIVILKYKLFLLIYSFGLLQKKEAEFLNLTSPYYILAFTE